MNPADFLGLSKDTKNFLNDQRNLQFVYIFAIIEFRRLTFDRKTLSTVV